jgi:hypothetical protein
VLVPEEICPVISTPYKSRIPRPRSFRGLQPPRPAAGTHGASPRGVPLRFANLFGVKEATTIHPTHTAIPLTGASPLPEGTTLAQVHAEFIHLMAQENLNHHRMGQLYNYIVENKLAEKAASIHAGSAPSCPRC